MEFTSSCRTVFHFSFHLVRLCSSMKMSCWGCLSSPGWFVGNDLSSFSLVLRSSRIIGAHFSEVRGVARYFSRFLGHRL